MSGVWKAYQRRLTASAGVRLSPKQLCSLREADGQVNIWHGSVRSGKTIASIIRWLVFVENAPALGELVMVGRTRDTVWRNVILPMQDPTLVGERYASAVTGNFGAASIRIFGRRVHILGASDSSSELAIRGMTVAGAYVDEVTTLVELFFSQLITRMSVAGARTRRRPRTTTSPERGGSGTSSSTTTCPSPTSTRTASAPSSPAACSTAGTSWVSGSKPRVPSTTCGTRSATSSTPAISLRWNAS